MLRISVAKNRRVAETTIEGPVGVSHWSDPHSPNETDRAAMMVAKMAICSGLFDIWRAAAAGIMSSDVMSRMPTTFIATATTTAIRSMKTKRVRATDTPST